MSIEASNVVTTMKQALEALENYDGQTWEETKDAITSLRKAIAEAEKQEPVGILNSLHCNCGATWTFKDGALKYKSGKPQHKWLVLTDEEVDRIEKKSQNPLHAVILTDAKLKEKNAQPKAEQDWSLLEATQESLREHMAMVKDLQAAVEVKLKEKNT